MESSFSLKPRPISLVTHAPLCSPLAALSVGVFRSEFLGGCGHNLRLPRKSCKKLRQNSRPNCYKILFKASLNSQPFIVLAAAVSAATVAYFAYSRKYLNVVQMSGSLSLALSEQIRSMMSWILTDSHFLDLWKKEFIGRRKVLIEETKEHCKEDKDVSAEIKLRDNEISGETLTEVATWSQFNMAAPDFCHNLALQKSETFETNLDADPSADHTCEEAEPLGEGDTSIQNLIFRNSKYNELHTINEASLEKLDGVDSLLPRPIFQKNSSYTSLINNSTEDLHITTLNVVLPIEKKSFPGKFDNERPLGHHNPGLFWQQDSRSRKELRKKGKNINLGEAKESTPSSNPRDKKTSDKHDPSWQLRVYNQLLREGR